MVSTEPSKKLRWLEAPELQKLGYGPSAEGTIQHARQGKSSYDVIPYLAECLPIERFFPNPQAVDIIV